MTSPRDLARTDRWWDSKIPPVLAFCYAGALVYDVPSVATIRCLSIIVFVGLCAGSYGHLVNDAFDIKSNRGTGQPNQMAGFAWRWFGICAVILALAFALAILFQYSVLSLKLLVLEYLLLTFHSILLLRSKERRALGIVCDSMGARAVPCLYALSVMAGEATRPAENFTWTTVMLAASSFVWALCLGIKGILIHKFHDRVDHLQPGITRIATEREIQTVRLLVNRVYAIELCAFVGVLLVLCQVAPLLLAAAVAYLVMMFVKVSRNLDFFVYSRKPAATTQWWQFSHPFYECYFPLVLAVQVSWSHPWLTFLPVFQILVFRNHFRRRFGEVFFFLQQILVWMVWRGQLHLDCGAKASVRPLGLDCARVKIREGGSQPWHVRLIKTFGALRAWERYEVSLLVRASKPRSITLGVWQNHAPWMSVGLSEIVQVSREWKIIKRTFFAAEEEKYSYLGLWLGGEPGTVDIRHCKIARVKPASVHQGAQGVVVGSPASYRVFVAAAQWNLTGVNIYSEHLVRGLQARSADARILLTERQTERVQRAHDLIPLPSDVQVEDLPVAATASWSARWVALVRHLSCQTPCIFIPNADYRHSCVSPKLPAGVGIVGIVHSDDPLHYEHVARLGRYWDAIICVSDTIARKVGEMDPAFLPRLHVISNGLPVVDRLPERTPEAPDSGRRLRIMYHGGLNTHQKRILDIAAILDECVKRGVPIRMTVAGDGTEREALLRACDPHVRSGAFQYVGLLPHDEIECLLRQHDVYLLPSAFEGLPYALLEAMANGCVPLVTDIASAVPELIQHGVNGYRVQVGDIAAFAHYLQLLHADPELRERLRVESHRTLLGSRYDLQSMVDSYLQVFEQVLVAARTGTYRRPSGLISPPPREVAGISIFPMDHGPEVEKAELRLTGPQERTASRVRRILNHFVAHE